MRWVVAGRASGVKTPAPKLLWLWQIEFQTWLGHTPQATRERASPSTREKWTMATISRADTAKKDSSEGREKKKEDQRTIRIGTLNVSSLTRRGLKLVDFMDRRKVKILCVQETKWKGSKARELGNGYKLFYNGVDSKRNGVGIILSEELTKIVLLVKRRSDRVMWMKMDLSAELVNIMSAYALQTGCEDKEKIEFWEEMNEEIREIPENQKAVD